MFRVLIFMFIHSSLLNATWLDRKAEGWAWYEDKMPEETNDKKEDFQEEIKQLSPEEKLAEVKKLLEKKLALAILNPTQENVWDYQIEQLKWLMQSAKFSEVWAHNLLNHPELDPTATSHPATQYGIKIKKEMDNQKRAELINKAAQEYGIFFFYEGNAKPSQAFSGVVKMLETKYSFNVRSITMDKTLLPEFPDSIENQGIAEKMNVSILPSLYLVKPVEKIFLPISYGMEALDQIEKNIVLQLTEGF